MGARKKAVIVVLILAAGLIAATSVREAGSRPWSSDASIQAAEGVRRNVWKGR